MEDTTMTAAFVPSPEFRKLLDELGVPKAEYVVEDPITVEATTEFGETMRYPTAVRERIVRCRDCENYRPAEDDEHEDGCALAYAYLFETSPDGFCAWGKRRGE